MREIITAPDAPDAVGPYSHAVKAGGLLFISGQIPLDPATGELIGDTAAAQAKQCLANLAAIAVAAGTDISQAVKCTVLLTNMGDFGDVNEAYAAFFPTDPPARIAYEISALPKKARVEIDAVVALPD
jgi:2-iminobutanoate/2-iminopropanoate deaminase